MQPEERGAIELIEEATHLLRRSPLSVLARYYVGSAPFVLGLLFFWVDMSRDAFAFERVTEESLALAGLFVWMKVWQTRYAAALRGQLSGYPEVRPAPGTLFRAGLMQSAVQPTALVMLPLGVLLLVPFAWIYGFYQSFTVLADGTEAGLRAMIAKARKHSALWSRQGWLVLTILLGFALFVFVDVAIAILLTPSLIESLLGIGTGMSWNAASLLNSTFLVICLGVTYLCVDPLVKAIYVLRCFYGAALATGEDLLAALRQTR